MIDFISQPWHWAVSGSLIAVIMWTLILFGKRFGMSTSLKTMCAIGGAGKMASFFDYDWKTQIWNLVVVVGAVIGGYIASHHLASPAPVDISVETQAFLTANGVSLPSDATTKGGFYPEELFSISSLATLKGFVLLIVGGFFIGFGTRWAGGCTSGHAISGLSNLQLPSLVAVVGFFIGGLITTFFLLPFILSL